MKFKKINKSKVDMNAYQQQTNVRRTMNCNQVDRTSNFDKIIIATDADGDG
ncbi:MAG TPA: hypothetical protein PLA71_00105 [Saccharofermentans sp.]|nr:hypothetical protein [Saccharofermentans sp.]